MCGGWQEAVIGCYNAGKSRAGFWFVLHSFPPCGGREIRLFDILPGMNAEDSSAAPREVPLYSAPRSLEGPLDSRCAPPEIRDGHRDEARSHIKSQQEYTCFLV